VGVSVVCAMCNHTFAYLKPYFENKKLNNKRYGHTSRNAFGQHISSLSSENFCEKGEADQEEV